MPLLCLNHDIPGFSNRKEKSGGMNSKKGLTTSARMQVNRTRSWREERDFSRSYVTRLSSSPAYSSSSSVISMAFFGYKRTKEKLQATIRFLSDSALVWFLFIVAANTNWKKLVYFISDWHQHRSNGERPSTS